MKIELNLAEAKALYELIYQLSDGNPGSVFDNDGSDEMSDPTISAAVKLYSFAGYWHLVPENLNRKTPVIETYFELKTSQIDNVTGERETNIIKFKQKGLANLYIRQLPKDTHWKLTRLETEEIDSGSIE